MSLRSEGNQRNFQPRHDRGNVSGLGASCAFGRGLYLAFSGFGLGSEDPLGWWKGSSIGDGWAFVREQKNPRLGARDVGLRRHRFGSGCRGGFGLRGRAGGFGDAGNEAFDQLGGTFQGAAGVGAGVLEGGKGDHEGEDAPGWIAGSDGDGGSGDVVLCSVHIFICFGLLCPFTEERGDVRAASGSGLQRAPLVPAPAPKPRGEGQR